MCLLTYFPIGVQPDTAALQRGSVNNPDGHGYAIIVKDEIIVRKSMDPDRLIEEFASLRRKHPELPALFHSRIGTGGTIGKYNCHPFEVGSDPRTVVAHNGIMPRTVQPAKGDRRCDTRIFAETHLPYRNLNSARSRRKLGHWLGTDKIVVLTVHPDHRQWSYIVNERHGQWDDTEGIWYSNSSHTPYYGRPWTSGYGGGYPYIYGAPSTHYRGYYAECWSEEHDTHYHYGVDGAKICGCYVVSEHPEEPGFGSAFARSVTSYDDWPPQADTVRTETTIGLRTVNMGPSTGRLASECIGCRGKGVVNAATLTCVACLTCNECGGSNDDTAVNQPGYYPCMCYTPSRLTDDAAGELDQEMQDDIDRAITKALAETEEL